jgi:hypothetical protein
LFPAAVDALKMNQVRNAVFIQADLLDLLRLLAPRFNRPSVGNAVLLGADWLYRCVWTQRSSLSSLES